MSLPVVTGNISGFTVDERGHISPLAGSTRPLSSGTSGAAQVSFDRSGNILAVTGKAANAIALYVVRHDDDRPEHDQLVWGDALRVRSTSR